MDGSEKCNDRGYHEFRTGPYLNRILKNIKCEDCQLEGADYLVAGWVHPQ